MATQAPIELYVVSPFYARGEHIIGKNATNDEGKPNMIRVGRGEVIKMPADAAKDILIAKQAIDNKNCKHTERAAAEAFVKERLAIENPQILKKAA